MTELPIHAVLPALLAALHADGHAVLQAPPGAGKTTVVPPALLAAPWLAGRIVMLEPRRMAARAAARRMSALLGEAVGGTVGYRVRLDTRVGPATRIEVVTEGVLTRMLQDDPALEGVGAVLFDEFHERSLAADLGLALTLETRDVLRPDLRLLVMSATLDGERVAALLGGAPVITGTGRSHPVETRYRPRRRDERVEAAVASAVREALAQETGDLLAFLPGAGEIRRAAELLAGTLPPGVDLHPLHGSLPADAQDRAIQPGPAGRRKVVLATSIAETSLTIEGVRVVVDAGLARVPRFSPRTGMARLETVRVSRAAAEQRRGRAGRLGPGVCVRLWGEGEQAQLLPFAPPEILEADLAPLALDLAAAGIADPLTLRWLDPPPAGAFAQARELLTELGALDAAGRVTTHGRRMARLGLHPRLAHLVLAAEPAQAPLACDLAALLEERDVLRGLGAPPDADLRRRLDLLRRRDHDPAADRDALRRVREIARHLRERAGVHQPADAAVPDAALRDTDDPDGVGRLLALAYPDRVAQRRPGPADRYLLRNGGGAVLSEGQSLSGTPWLVVAETDGRRPEARIVRAAPVSLEAIEAVLGGQVVREESVEWDRGAAAVRAIRRERLGALILREGPLRDPDPAAVAGALLGAVAREGLQMLPWEGATRLRERLAFLHALDPAWPDVSDGALLATLPDWLGPHLTGMRRLDELRRLDLAGALLGRLDWARRARLDELAPSHLEVPSGSRIPLDYSDPARPVLAVRLQEVFGWTDTPRIAGGRVPVTLHLLSPAHRPVQVTQDLAGFWRSGYFDVRKDLRGRYPRHPWPDDPLTAPPTRRAKPRGT